MPRLNWLKTAACRAILGKRLDLLDISRFDPQLGATLERMRSALAAHTASVRGPLLLDGVPIEDLCLTFTLPGYPDFELLPGGAELLVDSDNLRQYLDAVVDATLGSGIDAQVKALREGFNEVCSGRGGAPGCDATFCSWAATLQKIAYAY